MEAPKDSGKGREGSAGARAAHCRPSVAYLTRSSSSRSQGLPDEAAAKRSECTERDRCLKSLSREKRARPMLKLCVARERSIRSDNQQQGGVAYAGLH